MCHYKKNLTSFSKFHISGSFINQSNKNHEAQVRELLKDDPFIVSISRKMPIAAMKHELYRPWEVQV